MNLRTRYLGLDLPHPLITGASPMVDDLDTVRQLEDAGTAAIVMHSLFEEQIVNDELATMRYVDVYEQSFAEAMTYVPQYGGSFRLGPDEYLEQIQKIREAVDVPVIGSLNGTTRGGWLEFARSIESAGAAALELNVYELPSEPSTGAEDIESKAVSMLEAVLSGVGIPVAVKLSPFYTSLPHFAARLDGAGASALVLFNRFYQPDIDVDELEVSRALRLSDSRELLLRLRWIAILSGRLSCDLAVSGGVHDAVDAVKSIMTGAHAVQMVSALLRRGPAYLRDVLNELNEWLEEHEYDSLEQMRGSMNHLRCPDASAFERANYVRILQTWEA